MRNAFRHWASRSFAVSMGLLAAGLCEAATTWTVTTAGDDASGITCPSNTTCATLRDAVHSANAGDSINFSSLFDTSQTIVLTGGEILINKNLTVIGKGADLLDISGNNVSRIFRVGGGVTFNLSAVTIRDGLAADVGGGIVSDGTLNLTDCVVTGNRASTGFTGGGVYEAGGTGIFNGCTFDNNRANTGAGVYVINASVTFINSTVSGNVASANGGGIGFRPFNNSQALGVFDTTIAYNRSPAAGGILLDTSATATTQLVIGGSLLGNNTGLSIGTTGANAVSVPSNGYNLASDGGGGFLTGTADQINKDPRLGPLSLNAGRTPTHALLAGSPALDQGLKFLGKTTDQRGAPRAHVINGLTPPASGDSSDIGAVEMQAIIVANTDSSGFLSLSDALAVANGNPSTINDIIFASPLFDTAQTIDLAAALPDIGSSVTITGPGANLLTVRRELDPATPDFTVFNIPNLGLNVAISGLTISNGRDVGAGAGQDGFGGGIDSSSNLALTNVHLTGNTATNGGGVSQFAGDGTFINSTFSNNRGIAQGGGINFQGDGGRVLRLINSTASGNASTFGGGIFNSGFAGVSTLEVVNSTIAGNGGDGIFTIAQGGAAATTLRNSIIANNSGDNFGTAVAAGGPATVTSRGFNLASDGGGGFLNQASDQLNVDPRLGPLMLGGGTTPTHALLGGSPALDKGNSVNRTTDQRGAARAFDIASIAAASGGDEADIGAVEMQAIVVDTAQATGAGSLDAAITAANANGSGLDDILFASPLFDTPQVITLTAALSDITGNVTLNGPGANRLTVQRDYSAASQFRLFNNSVTGLSIAISGMTLRNGDVGNGFGGAIHSFANLALSNVNVTGNKAGEGGGVWLQFGDGAFNGSTFSNNVAAVQGGGIDFESAGASHFVLANSTVSGNVGHNGGPGGGGIQFNAIGFGTSTLDIINSTIVDNVGYFAGGIDMFTFSGGKNVYTSLRNSIVANNINGNLASNAAIAGFISLGYNLIGDDPSSVFTVTTGDQVNTDPLLGPLSLNGGTVPTHVPLGGSPALDKGNSSGLTTDQRGVPRAFDIAPIVAASGGDASDIGAVEAQAIIVSNTLAEGTGDCNAVSCTLRQAITTANGSSNRISDILFARPLFYSQQTIDLTAALPDITSNVAINGPGADLLTVTRDNSAPNFPIFRVPNFGRSVAINGMTISNGHNAAESGGGIETYSDLALANVWVTGNYSIQFGGGVAMLAGNGTFTDSAFTDNTSGNYGGGLSVSGNSNHTLSLRGSTVSGNTTVNGGGGIAVLPQAAGITAVLDAANSTIVDNAPNGIETNAVGGTAITALRNSIVASNGSANFHNSAASGFVVSEGFNLSNAWNGTATLVTDITAPARLAPLRYWGGPTPTHALLDASPAFDAGDSSGATSDQRGFSRPFDLGRLVSPPGDAADIGAFEAQSLDILFINGFESD